VSRVGDYITPTQKPRRGGVLIKINSFHKVLFQETFKF
jgi:hypothetical protein